MSKYIFNAIIAILIANCISLSAFSQKEFKPVNDFQNPFKGYVESILSEKTVLPKKDTLPYRDCGTVVPDAEWETWFSEKVTNFNRNRALNGLIVNYNIPVIIHIIHSGTPVGVNENISLAQAQSQIAILNADFSGTNSDISTVPSVFASAKGGNSGIQFCLSKVDINGNSIPEIGIDRINWKLKVGQIQNL